MSGIVYKAVYSDTHLSHFKYIDKWKSKSGKWVYKYKKDVTDELEDLKSKLESKMAQYRGAVKKKAKNGQQSSKGGWHDIGQDVVLSQKEKYNQSVQGNTHTRLRKVTDSSGRTTTRREYKDIAEQKSVDRSLAQYNEFVKGNNRVKRFIMNFNDKYGPKYVSSLEGVDGEGKHYVIEYTRNFFGNRPISADVYTYTEQKKVKRKNTKRSGKYRNAVKPMTHQKYIAHHGIKGQKWGVRRYQNEDGTLTEEGYRYYGIERRKFRERDNIKDTGRRSAASSAKSTAKSQAKWGTVGAVGTLAAGAFLGAPAVAAVSIAGAEYIASLGVATAVGAILGRGEGRQAAKQQNRAIQSQIISGNSFVISQLTATSTVNIVGPYRSVKTSIRSKR